LRWDADKTNAMAKSRHLTWGVQEMTDKLKFAGDTIARALQSIVEQKIDQDGRQL
jgi:hypothetical protein